MPNALFQTLHCTAERVQMQVVTQLSGYHYRLPSLDGYVLHFHCCRYVHATCLSTLKKAPNPSIHPLDIPLIHPPPSSVAPDTLNGRKSSLLQILHLNLRVFRREILICPTRHHQDVGLYTGQRLLEHFIISEPAP